MSGTPVFSWRDIDARREKLHREYERYYQRSCEQAYQRRSERWSRDFSSLEAYRALGFLHAFGAAEEDGMPGYGYLIYPHRPIVSFDARTGGLLNELCVSFPDRESREEGERLPDADDVLAKWMAIRGDELGLLAEANIWPPGRQIDPDQARRDLIRLQEWTSSASDSPSDGLAAAQ